MRYLGVDWGKKRVGLAISDPGGMLATPLKVLQRQNLEQIVAEIATLCTDEAVEVVVVGLPLNMDGSRGSTALEADRLARMIGDATGLPIELWDERLSSVSAERHLIDADMSRTKRKRTIDKVAAQIILQTFLDSHRGQQPWT